MLLMAGVTLAIACGVLAQDIEPADGTFFVATDGNDAWSGSLPKGSKAADDGPFRTLAAARDAVSASEASNRRVIIREGTHCLDEPLTLGPDDSGTAASPIVWMAHPGEEVTLSGGRPVTGWEQGEGGVWAAPLADGWTFRQLRVGDEMQTLCRYPDAVPDEPATGGWLFSRPRMIKEGQWGATVSNIHTRGDWIEWKVNIPVDGDYALWMRYGAKNEPHGRTDMNGRTTFQVDGGENVPLENLPDTAGWRSHEWSNCATLSLTTGQRVLRWTNREGGGIDFDAWAITTDPAWEPVGTELSEPADGAHLIIRQAEAWEAAEGREMKREIHFAASKDAIPFAEGDIPADFTVPFADVMIFPAWGWVGGPVQVGGIDFAESMVRLTGANAQQEVRRGNRYYLRNARQALNQPGEFFVDDGAGEVLYMPQSEEFGAIAPVHDRIIQVEDAEHIQFRGLSFRDTTYSREVGSLYQPDDAAIHLASARDIVIQDCTFSHLGGYAVNMSGTTTRCKVLGCRITDMGQGGVIATGNEVGNKPTDCTVAGCHIDFLGRVYKHVAGVYVTTGDGFRVAHNTITDVPRYAISFKSYDGERFSHDCIAEYNEMIRTNTETNDTGAIETLGRDRKPSGNIIRYNVILDVIGMKHRDDGGIISPYYTWGVYLDDYSSGTEVRGNIVARTYRGGFHNHLGFDNIVENNVFVDGQLQQAEWNGSAAMRNNTFDRNIIAYSNPDAIYLRSSGWDRAVLSSCDKNVVWWSGGDAETAVTPEGPMAKWREAGFAAASVIADPLFVDAENDDYRLQPGSPALKLGFEPIPVEKIGVKGYVAGEW
jgi:hypothetical protein